LKVGDLAGSFVEWRERPKCHVREDFFGKNGLLHLRVGDICLTGSAHRPSYIGLKVDLIDELPPSGAMPSGEVIAVRLNQEAPLRPEALLFYLRSTEGYHQVQDLVRGSTGHLYPRDLVKMEVPVPDESGQKELARMFWEAAAAFRSYLEHESQAIAKARGLLGESDVTYSSGKTTTRGSAPSQGKLDEID